MVHEDALWSGGIIRFGSQFNVLHVVRQSWMTLLIGASFTLASHPRKFRVVDHVQQTITENTESLPSLTMPQQNKQCRLQASLFVQCHRHVTVNYTAYMKYTA